MRILILANNDVGLYKFRKELIIRLIENNEIHVSVPNGNFNNKLKEMPIYIHNLNFSRRGINPFVDFILVLKYLRLINEVNPNIIISYTIKPNIYGGFIARLLKIPYYVNITGLGTVFQKKSLLKKIITFMYRISLKTAACVFFENTSNKDTFMKLNIVKENNSIVLNGAGVNVEEYGPLEYPSTIDKINFLFIGRLMKEKGINELLSAFKKLYNIYPNVKLTLVGEIEQNEIIDFGLIEGSDYIDYLGFKSDITSEIKKCHVVILPSWHEGMSNALLEAASCARPLITTNIPGCKEIIVEGKNGYLFEKKNETDLLEKMITFCNLELRKMKEMGEFSRLYVDNNFNRNSVIDKTISIINK